MKKRIVLVGKSGSGKDHARRLLSELGADYAIPFTTRPPRDNEVTGVDYHFINEETFQSITEESGWYVFNEFNGWRYGITIEQFYTEQGLFIMSPAAISKISPKDRALSNVVYLNMSEDIRRKRILERQGNADSVDRRIAADEVDFMNFNDYDVCVLDPAFSMNLIEIIYNKSFN
jgi:guanylate kinase